MVVLEKSVHASQINERLIESNVQSHIERHSIMFPYPCFKAGKLDCCVIIRRLIPTITPNNSITRLLTNFHVFPKVYAVDDTSGNNNDSTINVDERQTASNVHTSTSLAQSHFEVLARRYIEKETGRERVRALFNKNHKAESSLEMLYIKFTLVQICFISFFMKYVPAWKLAKQDFIQENNATAFRTRFDALRKMNDHASLKAILEGATFATKITAFSAGFLFLSQTISSYRNKTSFLEYTIAAGITGGLARLQMGPKGFVAGSFVGVILGTLLGCATSTALHLCDLTQDARHLQDVISRLEVERSIIGDHAFEDKMQKLMNGLDPTPLIS